MNTLFMNHKYSAGEILSMSDREYRAYNRSRILRLRVRNLFIVSLLAIMVSVIITVCICGSKSRAGSEEQKEWYLYATTVWMNCGDDIHSVAEAYMDELHYPSVDAYEKVLIRTNHFNEDGIAEESGYIVVPYYSTEFRMLDANR